MSSDCEPLVSKRNMGRRRHDTLRLPHRKHQNHLMQSSGDDGSFVSLLYSNYDIDQLKLSGTSLRRRSLALLRQIEKLNCSSSMNCNNRNRPEYDPEHSYDRKSTNFHHNDFDFKNFDFDTSTLPESDTKINSSIPEEATVTTTSQIPVHMYPKRCDDLMILPFTLRRTNPDFSKDNSSLHLKRYQLNDTQSTEESGTSFEEGEDLTYNSKTTMDQYKHAKVPTLVYNRSWRRTRNNSYKDENDSTCDPKESSSTFGMESREKMAVISVDEWTRENRYRRQQQLSTNKLDVQEPIYQLNRARLLGHPRSIRTHSMDDTIDCQVTFVSPKKESISLQTIIQDGLDTDDAMLFFENENDNISLIFPRVFVAECDPFPSSVCPHVSSEEMMESESEEQHESTSQEEKFNDCKDNNNHLSEATESVNYLSPRNLSDDMLLILKEDVLGDEHINLGRIPRLIHLDTNSSSSIEIQSSFDDDEIDNPDLTLYTYSPICPEVDEYKVVSTLSDPGLLVPTEEFFLQATSSNTINQISSPVNTSFDFSLCKKVSTGSIGVNHVVADLCEDLSWRKISKHNSLEKRVIEEIIDDLNQMEKEEWFTGIDDCPTVSNQSPTSNRTSDLHETCDSIECSKKDESETTVMVNIHPSELVVNESVSDVPASISVGKTCWEQYYKISFRRENLGLQRSYSLPDVFICEESSCTHSSDSELKSCPMTPFALYAEKLPAPSMPLSVAINKSLSGVISNSVDDDNASIDSPPTIRKVVTTNSFTSFPYKDDIATLMPKQCDGSIERVQLGVKESKPHGSQIQSIIEMFESIIRQNVYSSYTKSNTNHNVQADVQVSTRFNFQNPGCNKNVTYFSAIDKEGESKRSNSCYIEDKQISLSKGFFWRSHPHLRQNSS